MCIRDRSLGLTLTDINEFGRFDELFKTFNKEKAKLYFEEQEGKKIVPPKVNIKKMCIRDSC